jgi:hypothetical protein
MEDESPLQSDRRGGSRIPNAWDGTKSSWKPASVEQIPEVEGARGFNSL